MDPLGNENPQFVYWTRGQQDDGDDPDFLNVPSIIPTSEVDVKVYNLRSLIPEVITVPVIRMDGPYGERKAPPPNILATLSGYPVILMRYQDRFEQEFKTGSFASLELDDLPLDAMLINEIMKHVFTHALYTNVPHNTYYHYRSLTNAQQKFDELAQNANFSDQMNGEQFIKIILSIVSESHFIDGAERNVTWINTCHMALLNKLQSLVPGDHRISIVSPAVIWEMLDFARNRLGKTVLSDNGRKKFLNMMNKDLYKLTFVRFCDKVVQTAFQVHFEEKFYRDDEWRYYFKKSLEFKIFSLFSSFVEFFKMYTMEERKYQKDFTVTYKILKSPLC